MKKEESMDTQEDTMVPKFKEEEFFPQKLAHKNIFLSKAELSLAYTKLFFDIFLKTNFVFDEQGSIPLTQLTVLFQQMTNTPVTQNLWNDHFNKDFKDQIFFIFGKEVQANSKSWRFKQVREYLVPPVLENLKLLTLATKAVVFNDKVETLREIQVPVVERVQSILSPVTVVTVFKKVPKNPSIKELSKHEHRKEKEALEKAQKALKNIRPNDRFQNVPVQFTELRNFETFWKKVVLDQVINPLFGDFGTFLSYSQNTSKLIFNP